MCSTYCELERPINLNVTISNLLLTLQSLHSHIYPSLKFLFAKTTNQTDFIKSIQIKLKLITINANAYSMCSYVCKYMFLYWQQFVENLKPFENLKTSNIHTQDFKLIKFKWKHQTINGIVDSAFAGSYFKPTYPCDLFVSSNKLQKKDGDSIN